MPFPDTHYHAALRENICTDITKDPPTQYTWIVCHRPITEEYKLITDLQFIQMY